MFELPIAHYFLSVKVGAAHYVIKQTEIPLPDIIMSLNVIIGQLL